MGESHYPLSNSQWGFQAGKSTVTALLATTYDFLNQLEAGKEICTVFFDFCKAFDKVPHRPLLDKLGNLRLGSHILQWITSYLTERKQRVVINGVTSETASVVWCPTRVGPWTATLLDIC